MLKLKRYVMGALQTNCYILYDEDSGEAAIVDPACNGDKIARIAEDEGLRARYIIITHAHADHIAGLDALLESTGAAVCIGEGDAASLNDSVKSLCVQFGMDAPKAVPEICLKEGQKLSLGKYYLTILETPGHTPGGICIYSEAGLICGDTLFFESVGRWDFPGGSFEKLIKSIKDKLFLLPDSTRVFPGHGSETTIKHEKLNNPMVI